MSKHTTGPWSIDETFGLIMAGETIEVAACHAGRGGDAQANARLIAAAPDLLELVKLILKEWEAPTEGVPIGALIARLSQYSAEARAVIAKAEGK